MYIITGKTSGIVWDKENNKPLIKFSSGQAQTNDKNVASKLEKMGYIINNSNKKE